MHRNKSDLRVTIIIPAGLRDYLVNRVRATVLDILMQVKVVLYFHFVRSVI